MSDDPINSLMEEPSDAAGGLGHDDLFAQLEDAPAPSQQEQDELSAAYRTCFAMAGGPASAPGRVLNDLAAFCHMHESSFSTNAQLAARNEGRREVFLRILRLSRRIGGDDV